MDTFSVSRIPPTGTSNGRGKTLYTPEVIWAGAGKIESYEPYEQAVQSSGDQKVSQRYTFHTTEEGTPTFSIGDVVTCTKSLYAPKAVGKKYRIAGLQDKSIKTAGRYLVDILP